MEFIVLVGVDNTGKTTTLKKVVKDLVTKGASIVNDPRFHKFGSYVSSLSQLTGSLKNEITILLKYKDRLIGITTYGDVESVIKNKIDIFVDVGCPHIICASHPQGSSSYTYLESVVSKNSASLIEVAKIGCKGDKKDAKYGKVCEFADRLAVDEIISYI